MQRLLRAAGLGPALWSAACPLIQGPGIPQLASSAWHVLKPGQCLQSCRSKYSYAFKRSGNTPGLVFWKPRTPGLRHKITIDYKALGIYTGLPDPSLSFREAKFGGRNMHGHITVRGRGGGSDKIIRDVDFRQRDRDLGPGVVERVELDPNRSAFLALVRYEVDASGQPQPIFKYHIAPVGLRIGDTIEVGPTVAITPGNRLPLVVIPLGIPIHNIELVPGRGGEVARAAGSAATIQFKEAPFAVVKMPSGEVRRIDLNSYATVGTVSNTLHKLTIMGKAGVNRNRGRRPKVRGVAMNPVDHPHGGKTPGGRPSCTPWGVYCKGKRTRLRNKWTNRFIVTRAGNVPIEKFVQAKKWRAAAEIARKQKTGATMPVQRQGPPDRLLGPRPPVWGKAPKQAMASG